MQDQSTATCSGDEDGAHRHRAERKTPGRTEHTVGTHCPKAQNQAERLWGDTSQDAEVHWWGARLGEGSRGLS